MRAPARTFMLTAGYYTDEMAEQGQPPNVFYIAEQLLDIDDPLYREQVVADMVDMLAEAIRGTYGLSRTPWGDTFWTGETRYV